MALSTLLLGCFILYGTSKHFPKSLGRIHEVLAKRKNTSRITGCILLAVSAYFFTFSLGTATGLVVFFTALAFALSVLTIVLSLHRNFIYLVVSVILIAPFISFIF